MRRICASLLCIVATSAAAHGQTGQPLQLSEQQFIEHYHRAEPRLRVAEAAVAESAARVEAARALPNPSLRYERAAVGGEVEQHAGLDVRVALGGRSARIADARARVRAATRDAAHRRWELLVDAVAVYYDTVHDRDHVALLDDERAALAQLVEVAEAQARAGEIAGYAHDRLALELLRHDQRLAQARAAYRVARTRLAGLLGHAEVIPTEVLNVQRPPELASLIASAESADGRRADWHAALARADAARHAADAAGSWWVPPVTLAGGVKTVATADIDASGYFVAATVELPVFNRRQAQRAHAAAARRRSAATLEYLAVAIPTDIRTAHGQLEARLEQLQQLVAEQLPRVERLLQRAAVMFREGAVGVAEVTDAQRTVVAVREHRLILHHRAKLAELELWRALGRRPNGDRP